MRSRFAVTYEDGHREVFEANEVQYANGGAIIQQRDTIQGELRRSLASGNMEQSVTVTVQLRVVLAPPRSDMAPALRWHRIESIDPLPDLEDMPASTDRVPALSGEEARN